MKNRIALSVGLFSAAGMLLMTAGALADTSVTVGVGHMCCGGCQTAAKAALQKVSKSVTITGKDITITPSAEDGNIVPVLDALRKGGFPATRIDAGSNPVTIGVGHLCCGQCKADLKTALAGSGIDALDPAAINIGDNSVQVRAKAGSDLNLAPVIAAMEKGGFSATSIKIGAASASAAHAKLKVARK